jgi:hypothetical protein
MVTVPSTASAYPHAFTYTGLSHQYEFMKATLSDGCVVTEVSDSTEVHYTTWTAFKSEPTHLTAAASDIANVPCTGDEVEFEPDDECVKRGMDTACIGQCPQNEDGLFICPEQVYGQDVDLSMGLGRVCWVKNATAYALHKPCIEGDHWVSCIPGKGDVRPFVAWNWI